jgi:hypothetical protein
MADRKLSRAVIGIDLPGSGLSGRGSSQGENSDERENKTRHISKFSSQDS